MDATFLWVLGLISLLTLASLLLPLANRIRFPYSVLLAAAGGLLGALLLGTRGVEPPGPAGDFLRALDTLDITSEAVFLVFLPALIFESALNINARHLAADIAPILLLAILGLLISTAVVGLSLWTVAGAGLVACLLIGAIVSSTDPVAVIAVFKDLGAPKRLSVLVEGESLFNDATAIVLFTILAGLLVEGGSASPLGAMGNFVKVFFGGIVTGLLAAWGMAWVIGRLRNLPLVQITLTVCLAYLSFLVAERYLHVSGVMSAVAAGLMINSFGRTQVSPETWHALAGTWEELGFWANSLIFFLVGLLIPKVLVDVSAADALLLAVVVVAAFFARMLVLFGVLPALHRLGLCHQVSLAYRAVMLWGGLRGAVALALALVVLETPEYSAPVQRLVVTMVTGFVLFTLFVNAPTMGMMLHFFGLDRLSPTDAAVRNRVMALSLSSIRDGLAQAAGQDGIDPALADEVKAEYDRRLRGVESAMLRPGEIPDSALQQVGLTTLTDQERQLYLQRFAEGLVSPRIARMLLAQVDVLLDGVKAGGVEGWRAAVNRSLGFGPAFHAALLLQRRLRVQGPLASMLAHRFEVLRASEAAVVALIAYGEQRMPSLLGEGAAAALQPLLQDRLQATRQAREALELQYPVYARTLQRRHLARIALRLEESHYKRMLDEQVISQEVLKELLRELAQRARAQDHEPRLDLGLDSQRLLRRVPFFSDLGAEPIREIARLLEPRLVVPGERVIRKGEPGESMYFISSGAVEVGVAPAPVRLGSGDFFGEIALLTRRPRTADVTAIGYCDLLVLHVDDFQPLMRSRPALREVITRVARERLGGAYDGPE